MALPDPDGNDQAKISAEAQEADMQALADIIAETEDIMARLAPVIPQEGGLEPLKAARSALQTAVDARDDAAIDVAAQRLQQVIEKLEESITQIVMAHEA